MHIMVECLQRPKLCFGLDFRWFLPKSVLRQICIATFDLASEGSSENAANVWWSNFDVQSLDSKRLVLKVDLIARFMTFSCHKILRCYFGLFCPNFGAVKLMPITDFPVWASIQSSGQNKPATESGHTESVVRAAFGCLRKTIHVRSAGFLWITSRDMERTEGDQKIVWCYPYVILMLQKESRKFLLEA